jgi:hypothetical protein
MSHLLVEIALRLVKIVAALVVGAVVYAVATGPLGAAGSVELFLLAFLAGAAAILLAESSPI